MLRHLVLAVLCAGVLMPCHTALVAQVAREFPQQKGHALEKLRAGVAYWEEELAKELMLLARGGASEASVDAARMRLAKARHDLAVNEKKFDVAREQRRVLVEIRDRELNRLQKGRGRGAAFDAELAAARRRLACARFLVLVTEGKHADAVEQVKLLVDWCEDELSALRKSYPWTVSDWELHRARNRLLCAHYLLVTAESKGKEVAEQLRRHVEVCERDLKDVQRLHRRRAATALNVYVASVILANARIRLANVEGKRGVVLEQLRDLVALHRESFWTAREDRRRQDIEQAIEWALARDQLRLEAAQRGEPADDLALAELGD